jgi:murein DD-endopeptidase MepM/ murein hydrolase activator NlpD
VPSRYTPRHAAPRHTLSTVLLPAVLVGAAGSALTGLTLSPASAADRLLSGTAATASAPAASASDASLPQGGALQVQAAARQDQPLRASRSGRTGEAVPDLVREAEVQAAATVAAEQAAAAARAAAARAADAEKRLAAERILAEQRAAAERAAQAAAAAPQAARPGDGRLTSSYGQRWGRLHAGIDLAAGVGAPVRAALDGTVVSAGNEGGYGRCVRIRHADGAVTVYAHLSSISVQAGQVAAGQLIGREGNTGQSTGPHLHFEVRYDDQPVDPLPWLRERGVAL